MSFGEGDLRERVDQLEKERDYWKRECADMLSEFWDTESGHCAMLDYPRPASEPAPSVIVMASRMGNDEYRERAEKRIAELEGEIAELREGFEDTIDDYRESEERVEELESLVRDMFAYIDNCCEVDLSFGCVDPVDCAYYNKAHDGCTKASSLKRRMEDTGLMEGGGDAETD